MEIDPNSWTSWEARRRGVYACALGMELADPLAFVKLLDQVGFPAKSTPLDRLLRTRIELDEAQFRACWPVEETIFQRGMSAPSTRQLDQAWKNYQALRSQSHRPLYAWSDLSQLAQLTWPVAFLCQSRTDRSPEQAARQADLICEKFIDDPWQVDMHPYAHHADHLFSPSQFRAWLDVRRFLAHLPPVDDDELAQACQAVAMSKSDFY